MNKHPVFESPLAGRWYSENRDALRRELDAMRPRPDPELEREVCAVVVPHAGYAYSGQVAASVYARLDPDAYDRVVVIGPSHHIPLRNCVSVLPVAGYRTPLGTSPADVDWLDRLRALPEVVSVLTAHAREHSDQIQIPLLQHFFGCGKRLACLVTGGFDERERVLFATRLRPLLDRRTLVVASTDFTHYGPDFGFQPFAPAAGGLLAEKLADLDGEVFEAFASWGDDQLTSVLADTGATVCGREVLSLLLALRPEGATVVKTAYATSGELRGDWTNSVSYLGALVKGSWEEAPSDGNEDRLSAADQEVLLKLARTCVESAARTGSLPPDLGMNDRLTPGLRWKRGGFVTLTLGSALRGCIGEIEPRREIWKVVRDHALDAALHDPRFRPVTPAEASALRIEISVLTPPRPVDSWREIEVGRHGVVLRKAGRGAVFLPQVAPEQGWDCATMLCHLARKAGLDSEAWQSGADFLVFEAQVFREDPQNMRNSRKDAD